MPAKNATGASIVIFTQVLIGKARRLYSGDNFGLQLNETVYALDSSTIDLCRSVFSMGRVSVRPKSGVKLHTLLDLRGNIPFIRFRSQMQRFMMSIYWTSCYRNPAPFLYRYRWQVEIYHYNYIYKIDFCLIISSSTSFFFDDYNSIY